MMDLTQDEIKEKLRELAESAKSTSEETTGVRTRVVVDFPSRESAADWFDEMRDAGVFGEVKSNRQIGLFSLDGLDAEKVSQGNTFIVGRVGERPDEFRMKLVKVETETRVV